MLKWSSETSCFRKLVEEAERLNEFRAQRRAWRMCVEAKKSIKEKECYQLCIIVLSFCAKRRPVELGHVMVIDCLDS